MNLMNVYKMGIKSGANSIMIIPKAAKSHKYSVYYINNGKSHA